ncbi:NAD-dependent epimerase/dehydratase family protein [Paenibacillus pinisoli]|uniref:NAD-dependent epimerase/dehydratase family protein n=1 Tax=Paenibacillus pinisoli TaxID=1276110 RepID=A0A3A6PAR5_9BACL|nr:SDR family oxidoreductase [Paenibacillus pinisoli]RJX36840.1 NAD-dependent epimerase/dehydratase family protein [Paenibacillus pinisoli]
MERRAVIAGATGLVGGELVKLLLSRGDYSRIIVLVRRKLETVHERLEQLVVDYDALEELPGQLFENSDVYCTLGTTRKKAGSKEQFERVDYSYPMALGRLAKRHEAARLLIVTAMGSDESSLFFYSQVKGRVEKELQQLQLRRLHIFRPSLILGDRQEHRWGESAAAKLYARIPFVFGGPKSKYRPITAKEIAEGMLSTAMYGSKDDIIIPSHVIAEKAEQLREQS